MTRRQRQSRAAAGAASRASLFAGLLAVAAMLACGGCATYSVDRTAPDGTQTHLAGSSLLTDKGIQRARVDGLGELEGYNAGPNVDAMRAVGEGLGAGLGAALKAAAK